MVAPAWGVTARLNLQKDEELKLAIGQLPEAPGRRVVRVDGKSVSGNALAEFVTMFWLTPAQDRLFKGPAGDRRKFLDRFTLMHAPDHGRQVVFYEKLRTERNRLLSDGVNDTSWYEAIEDKMSKHGAQIAAARCQTLQALIDEIEKRPAGAFPKAILSLDGEAEEQIQSGIDISDVEAKLRAIWDETRSLDMRAGRTLRGVHRADLKVVHAQKNMPAENCSTGEQKALLIGLMLAQARAQAAKHPFLLLDEVAAHLDENRRAALVEELIDLGTQVFMTGTDASLFDAFQDRAQAFEIKAGAVI